MKINQVEELTGIPKKNIRFYEDEGLIDPGRSPSNGYRNYSLKDVEQLERIKLRRKLDVSCENIRRLSRGETTISQVMEDQLLKIRPLQTDLDHVSRVAELLKEENRSFQEFKAQDYLETITKMEKEGIRFMNVQKSDVRKLRKAAILSALVSIGFFILMIILILWGNSVDPIPSYVVMIFILMLGVPVIGVMIALIQRLKEVGKGEINEASKY